MAGAASLALGDCAEAREELGRALTLRLDAGAAEAAVHCRKADPMKRSTTSVAALLACLPHSRQMMRRRVDFFIAVVSPE